jgi:hypothetical protein
LYALDSAFDNGTFRRFIEGARVLVEVIVVSDLVTSLDHPTARFGEGFDGMARNEPGRGDIQTAQHIEYARRANLGSELAARDVYRRTRAHGADPDRDGVQIE